MEIKSALSILALLVCVGACGSSGSGSSSNTTNPYSQCGNNVACNNQNFSNIYGPNSGGYYGGTQNCGGYSCQVYNIPQNNGGCNGGCGTQQYLVAPQGAYLPDQGIYGDGGGYFLGITIST